MLKLLIIAIAALLSGCATPPAGHTPTPLSSYRPVVDPAACPDCDYENDLYQCKAIAGNNTNYMSNTAGSAAVGAGFGAIMGAILGLDVGTMAAAGAAGGAIGGLGNEAQTVSQMIARCMTRRGYSVLR